MSSTETLTSTELSSMPDPVRNLIDSIEQARPLTPAKAKRLLEASSVTAADLESWADYDHPGEDSYGRKLVEHGKGWELMVMSWRPGSYSAIHDHGYTQWGAVKVFGDAEHAVFAYDQGELRTRSRAVMPAGSVVSVDHDLIHQMGNVGQPPYLTLHLYGCDERDDDVTGDARIFELDEGNIQYTSGGVFFALPEDTIHRREAGLSADLPTQLRHDVEMLRRLDQMPDPSALEGRRARLLSRIQSPQAWEQIRSAVLSLSDEAGAVRTGPEWAVLFEELLAIARLQDKLEGPSSVEQREMRSAQLWDQAQGPRLVESTVAPYLKFVAQQHQVDFAAASVLSAGCRTGLVESHLLQELGVRGDQLQAFDPSAGMVRIAAERVHARQAELRSLAGQAEAAQLVFASLQALQRDTADAVRDAVSNLAQLTRVGGLFVGDFLVPSRGEVMATARLGEQGDSLSIEQSRGRGGRRFEELLHLELGDERLRLRRRQEELDAELGPQQTAELFSEAFGAPVQLYDAISLQPLSDGGAFRGQRYLVVASRQR